MNIIREFVSFDNAGIITESKDNENGGKDLYMQGIFVSGGIRNLNGRIYPVREISNAVDAINSAIRKGESVLGECDHPEKLTINIDRVSHMIERMWMDGNNGIGRLKILPTPHGNIIRTLIESGVKLGVSSRGSGDVDDNGHVSQFEMITVDVVAKPSAPEAFPKAVFESLYSQRGLIIEDTATAMTHDIKAQKYLAEELMKWISSLK